jgi:hypothetical protein
MLLELHATAAQEVHGPAAVYWRWRIEASRQMLWTLDEKQRRRDRRMMA